MKNAMLPLLLLLVSTFACEAQKPQSNTLKQEKLNEIYSDKIGSDLKSMVDQFAHKALEDTLINSLSIGIVKNNVTLSFHYGELTKGRGNRPNNETIYEIASVTKTFTGTLAAKAVLEGRLNLEDDIRKYLPASYPNLAFEGQAIKIKHLLTHTAGLPSGAIGADQLATTLSEIEFNKAYRKLEDQQTKAQFFEYLSAIKIKKLPGTNFQYSNFGSNLMAYILERVYEKPFQSLIKDEILAKQHMDDTHFHTPKSKRGRLATGYLFDVEMPETNLAKTLWGGEGALKSTTKDILKYINFQFENNAFIEESHKKIFEIDQDYWIGYYWWIIENQSHDLHYRHDGGISRAKNVLVIYPESKIGISIITNQSAIRINDILSQLTYNIYKGLKPTK